ncbi:unnamed protein product [Linum trigynum]|uniref:Uncharacterized protein n=1 Tax=Linum trigynum TaxID=586398 RepID=A0AAV2CNY5_9ROSI
MTTHCWHPKRRTWENLGPCRIQGNWGRSPELGIMIYPLLRALGAGEAVPLNLPHALESLTVSLSDGRRRR